MALKLNPVVWFELPVEHFDRARRFYEAAFEIELTVHEMGPKKMAWFPRAATGGATGTLLECAGHRPSQAGTLIYLHVDDVDSSLARIERLGGRVIQPKQTIGDHGWVATFEDSEGNQVALHQSREDESEP